jgi:hypothetical protein
MRIKLSAWLPSQQDKRIFSFCLAFREECQVV